MPAQPSDPRTRRSRSALEAALWELIAERELTQIAIADITKRAGVNRSTFYEHYTDVHDLAASACTATFDELVAATPMFGLHLISSTEPADNPLTPMFSHVAEHAHLYRTLLGADGSARVINHLLQRIAVASHVNRRLTHTGPSTHADDPADISHDPEAAFIAGAVLGAVIGWLRRDCPGTPEELAAAIWPLLIKAASVTGFPALPQIRTSTE
ncbi:TetR/AcrR family transcriptional regulator [Nonomuraea turcica]|uniref:TetR/AcrR family transcriptional regulator n=1 Tax=Nonomuraea sp. G32 TaxID=3067274 RepID=UPI00273BCC76|nr:TetR/AcrR family transcriptional regulator [Nonomuraea sp. G32]MDP4509305.1 TetR/AcrR family transcriptional regulator C-terminal domain-containing protein [Nonomuraea sp. G32]